MTVLILMTILSVVFLGIIGYGIANDIKRISKLEKEETERLSRQLAKDLQ